jgi:hypothetical protein
VSHHEPHPHVIRLARHRHRAILFDHAQAALFGGYLRPFQSGASNVRRVFFGKNGSEVFKFL